VAAAYYVESRLRLLESIIRHSRMEHVKIAFDEWNVWYRVDPAEETRERGMAFLEEPYAQKDALFAAGIFLVLHRMCDIVEMANLAQMVNALGMIKTTDGEAVLTPLYHVFDLFVNHMGRTRLGLEIATECYSVKARSSLRGLLSFEVGNVPYLDGSATYDAVRNMLCLALVNYHDKRDLEVTIDVSDLDSARSATVHELSAPDAFAMNDCKNPNRVSVTRRSLALSGQRFVADLPPTSVNVIELPLLTSLAETRREKKCAQFPRGGDC